MSRYHGCLACGKAITWRFAICNICEMEYGCKPEFWPEWLRFLWRDEQKLRRQQRKVSQNEISFSHLNQGLGNDEFDGVFD